MDKTIEEIRKSVLAYCEEVCPNELSAAHLEIGMMKRMSMGGVFYWLHIGGLWTITIYAKSTDDHIFAAYRLLGLETRDAVAAEKRETERVRTSLNHAIALKNEQIQKRLIESNADRNDLEAIIDHERARNTALVAALEEIKKPWYVFRFGKRASLKSTLEQYKTRCMAIQDIVSLALAANTEKGGGDEA